MDRRDAITIRQAGLEVIDHLLDFDPMAQAGDASRRLAIREWVSAGLTLVAETEAGLVGYVVTLPGHLFDRDFIAMLIVRAGHRRRRVGSALLASAVRTATSQRVFTSTNSSNAPMKALLASMGWTYCGTLDGFDPGDPELFYYIDR